jgi:hypothetical protein
VDTTQTLMPLGDIARQATELRIAAMHHQTTPNEHLDRAVAHLMDAATELHKAGGVQSSDQAEAAQLRARLAELEATPPTPIASPDAGVNPDADLARMPAQPDVATGPPAGVTFASESTDDSFAGEAEAQLADPATLAAEQAAHDQIRERAEARTEGVHESTDVGRGPGRERPPR